METKRRLYIVCFGNSRKYRFEFEDIANADFLHHRDPLAEVQAKIASDLDKNFPGEPLAYYETPKITEVSYDDKDEYKSYPVLDENAIKDIEKELRNEIQARNDLNLLDRNAPYNDVAVE